MASILSGLLNKRKTLSDLSSMVDGKRQQGAAGCSVSLESTTYEIKRETVLDKFKQFFTRTKSMMNTLYVTFKFNVMSNTGGNHIVMVRMLYDPDGYLGGSNIIQIYCDCHDFTFRSAYALNQSGSLFRSQDTDLKLGVALGTAPKAGKTTGGVCKHCSAVLQYLMSNYQYLMG